MPEPPKLLERVVLVLTPPARREDVLGDLQERYVSPWQYLGDVGSLLPRIVWSQMRRTTSVQQLLIETGGTCSCFLAAVLWLEREPGPGPLGALIPAAAMQFAFVIANAYAPAREPLRLSFPATLAALCGLLSQAMLAVAQPALGLTRWPLLFGIGGSLVLLTAFRLFAPLHGRRTQDSSQEGKKRLSTPSGLGRVEDFQKQVRRSHLELAGAALFLAAMGISATLSTRVSDRAAGGLIIAAALYILHQTYKRWAVASAEQGGSLPTMSYRAQLEQRRDELRGIWSWYVWPYLTALLLFALRLPLAYPDEPGRWPKALPFAILSIVWSLVMGKLSARKAHQLQAEIDHLDNLQSGEQR